MTYITLCLTENSQDKWRWWNLSIRSSVVLRLTLAWIVGSTCSKHCITSAWCCTA